MRFASCSRRFAAISASGSEQKACFYRATLAGTHHDAKKGTGSFTRPTAATSEDKEESKGGVGIKSKNSPLRSWMKSCHASSMEARRWTSSGGDETRHLMGSLAFIDAERQAIADLFFACAKAGDGGTDEAGTFLDPAGVRNLLATIGEFPNEETLEKLFVTADANQDGKLHFDEFLHAADTVLGGAPARVVLVVGGPGSGKGILCSRLAEECGCVHMSCGDLLRDEVAADTPLGRQVAQIMASGGLVSSAVVTALLRRRMRHFPGARILLDGFPRSLENAHDFAQLCGKPELALHLQCDDTVLMERIMKRAREAEMCSALRRSDDTIDTALQRIRTFRTYSKPTLDWLRDQHIPIVNLDCSGPPESVWDQLMAIGRLMRPAAQFHEDIGSTSKQRSVPPPVQQQLNTPFAGAL